MSFLLLVRMTNNLPLNEAKESSGLQIQRTCARPSPAVRGVAGIANCGTEGNRGGDRDWQRTPFRRGFQGAEADWEDGAGEANAFPTDLGDYVGYCLLLSHAEG